MRPPARIVGAALAVATLALTACGGSDDSAEPASPPPSETDEPAVSPPADQASPADDATLETVSPGEIAGLLDAPPDGLVVLDVRTEEEFAEGHLEGAVMLDFYREDFAERLAELDRDTPYVVYCRSGNRSGQTLAMMRELGFRSVQEAEGGFVAWVDAGLPVATD